MTERARWMLLVLTLIVGLGGAVGIALYRVDTNAAEQQRDMCELMNTLFSDPDAPPPTTVKVAASGSGLPLP